MDSFSCLPINTSFYIGKKIKKGFQKILNTLHNMMLHGDITQTFHWSTCDCSFIFLSFPLACRDKNNGSPDLVCKHRLAVNAQTNLYKRKVWPKPLLLTYTRHRGSKRLFNVKITVNSEIFARILFSRVALKDIVATIKKIATRSWFTFINKRQNDLAFSRGFYFHET